MKEFNDLQKEIIEKLLFPNIFKLPLITERHYVTAYTISAPVYVGVLHEVIYLETQFL